MSEHEDLIAQFVGVTGASPNTAQEFLNNSAWDFSSAITEFYNPPEDNEEASQPPQPQSSTTSAPPQPIPTTSSMPPAASSSSSKPKKKFATLGDLSGSGGEGHGHSHSDDDDDDMDDDPNLYAGGEKSGLAVENPDDLKRKVFERAKRNLPRPGGDDPRAPTSRFTGTARTLGDDNTPSEVIPDPAASSSTPHRPDLVSRRLHFWADGFSVDDGPLYRMDDPRNAEILAEIKGGRAPMHILNVTQDQEVDVQLEQHRENYVAPKKKYKPFEGGGQRLGSPTPGGGEAVAPAAPAAAASASATAPQAAAAQAGPADLNADQPTISLQIRLGDGTRLVSRFNTTHTIGDVYDFVTASNPGSSGRPWVLMTTFPSKELTDKSQVLGDLADFKRGGVVVQKWK
ncbi:MAG: protein phosphatase regulator [Ramalina farinacea]|uniref:Protein phosphatase regulator n=1 Tax=Ramalina farinacea TaxID=258253 RepID=A0AA43QHI7_9LECA|nr:protein phosphatase regulator [Ramalina farinacea]